MSAERAAVPVRGRVVTGVGEASGFVTVAWVREQLRGWLGADPHPGTLNVQVSDPTSLAAWRTVAREAPLTLTPGEDGYCASGYFPVLLDGQVRGGVVLPHVPGYPADIIEVVATDNLRDRLGLHDGDPVTISWSTPPAPGGAAAAKDRHVEVCLAEDVESSATTGFEDYRLLGALPDFAFDDIQLQTTLFGRRLTTPLLISSMTGGGRRSGQINERVARLAQRRGLGMAVGSQKLMVRDPDAAASYQVRRWAPDILVFANLGLVHLNYGLAREDCLRAVEAIGADALLLYANPLHEAVQPHGDLNFHRLLDRLAELVVDFPYPVVVKEVGSGLPESLLTRLAQPPFDAHLGGVETAGLGGTHWGRVEALLAGTAVAVPEEELGTRTADSLVAAVRVLPDRMAVIASGGIRDGVQAAKALALGADAVGMALPFLRSAAISDADLDAVVTGFERQLRLSMWHIGCRDVTQLARGTCPPVRVQPAASVNLRELPET